MNMKKIAVTGSKGRLGSELVKNENCFPVVSDILDHDTLTDEILKISPEVVINCAAFTNVDLCETEEGYTKALEVNYLGVIELSCVCEELGCKLLHISTDYVFDGIKGNYQETDEPLEKKTGTPVNNYGWSKLGGEIYLLNVYRGDFLIVRTTGMYGNTEKHNFFHLVKNTIEDEKELYVTEELLGNQTYIPHFAEALIYIADRFEDFQEYRILHVASEEIISRYEFALRIADVFGYDKGLIIPVSNDDISSWVAKRLAHGGLIVSKAKELGVPIYKIDEGIKDAHKFNSAVL